jgi:membrane-bound lytic murein transglycosylase D
MKLPLETEDYVPRWIAVSIIDRHREYYGLEVPEIAPLSFETLEGVQLSKDLPLSFLATVTESSVRFISELNSALAKRETCFKATKAERYPGQTIHVPEGTKKAVLKALRANSYLRND